ncbi:hypothetical protein F511_45963 [Dorcoceras hygrometricum]|uniref:Uncharacterized protein n=1 Tax=Dorcoceras hygrometricum TaxID=472368 RepID=A0A2Z6ZUS3_9LAMI|nr:hypothetical protein F511_45963 [Dorcoceras hygrometricum]
MKRSARGCDVVLIFSRWIIGDDVIGDVIQSQESAGSLHSRRKRKRRRREIQSQATVQSADAIGRSVAPKWKEDKIAFWSAEEFWKLSNGKNFTEAIY